MLLDFLHLSRNRYVYLRITHKNVYYVYYTQKGRGKEFRHGKGLAPKQTIAVNALSGYWCTPMIDAEGSLVWLHFFVILDRCALFLTSPDMSLNRNKHLSDRMKMILRWVQLLCSWEISKYHSRANLFAFLRVLWLSSSNSIVQKLFCLPCWTEASNNHA